MQANGLFAHDVIPYERQVMWLLDHPSIILGIFVAIAAVVLFIVFRPSKK